MANRSHLPFLWGGQCGVCGPGEHVGHLQMEKCILII